MVSTVIVRRLAGNAVNAITSDTREVRNNAIFIENIKSRHGSRLESLDSKLYEADQAKSPAKSPIPGFLSDRLLSHDCRFVQVGSSVNGLSSDNSDIDLEQNRRGGGGSALRGRASDEDLRTRRADKAKVAPGMVLSCSELDLQKVFYPTDDLRRRAFLRDFHGNGDFKMQFITAISKMIKREVESLGNAVDSSVVLHHLRIPLLIVQLKSGQNIDIQFPDDQFQAIRNTNLIRHYVQCDSRLSRLFLYLRMLFDALEIRNSKYGLLSSYHILLLTIHFLQSEQALFPWPVLPVLCKTHSNLVGAHIPIDDVVSTLDSAQGPVEWTSNNKMTVAELVVRFVDYYSTFDASQNAIYIERGLAARRKQVSGDVHLLLVDPYSRTTVCRSSTAAKAFADSMTYLRRKMANGQFLDSFPNFPEATLFKAQTKWVPWRTQVRDKKAVVDKRSVDQAPLS